MKKKGNPQRNKKSDTVTDQIKSKLETTNPFELRINKVKHQVIGQKIKHGIGNPGASKSRINKIRLKTLQKISQLRSKSNIFVDKRIGEYDKSISKEDRINARIVHARKKKCKKDIFNLNDDEALTHLGEDILKLEEFSKPESDSDEEDNVPLNADFVGKAHFGGFLSKKTEGDTPKTHKEIIGDIILESKQKKQEKKAVKRENEELADQLNKQWKEMQSIVMQMKRKDDDSNQNKESYDVVMRQMKFEPRATASEALKSEEQIKGEEQQKKIELENERKLRMMKPRDRKKKKQALAALSVDRLNYYDGFESVKSEEKQNDASVIDENEKELSDAGSENSDDADSEDDEEDDNVSLDGSDASESELPSLPQSLEKQNEPKCNVPQTIDELSAFINNCTSSDVSLTLKSIADSLHPSLKSGNKAKLGDFYTLITKYLCTYRKEFLDVTLLDNLVSQLYDFAKCSPESAGNCYRDILSEKINHHEKRCSTSSYPSYDILITLKLCSILFSTSDYHHPIATPAMLLMSDILVRSYKVNLHTILSRLYLANLFYEYVAYSKRLAVEPLLFLQDIFYMASSQELLLTKYVPRHYALLKKKQYLLVNSEIQSDPSLISLKSFDPSKTLPNTNELKVSVIYCAAKVVRDFAKLYDKEPVFPVLFAPLLMLSDCLPLPMYPAKLVDAINDLKSLITNHVTKMQFLTFPNKKPPMLKMLEPKFEMKHSAVKKVTEENKLRVEKKIQQKIKKEERGLIREIRQEAQFVAGEQLKNQRLADEERKAKVKRLCQELSMQEGEFKKLYKKKK